MANRNSQDRPRGRKNFSNDSGAGKSSRPGKPKPFGKKDDDRPSGRSGFSSRPGGPGKFSSFGNKDEGQSSGRGFSSRSGDRPNKFKPQGNRDDDQSSSRSGFSSRSSFGPPKKNFRSGPPRGDKDFRKSDERGERPFRKRDDDSSSRPGGFSSGSSFGPPKRGFRSGPPRDRDSDRPEGGEKRPFKKRDDDSSSRSGFSSRSSFGPPKRGFKSGPPQGERDSSSEGNERRPFRKRDDDSSPRSGSFGPPKRGGFKSGAPRDDRNSDRSENREDRPFKRERTSSSRPSSRPSGTRKDDDEQTSFGQRGPKKFERDGIRKSGAKVRDKESKEEKAPTGPIRLNRFIANSGVCSRREADELITMGLISVNGKVVTTLGTKVNLTDEVRHENKVLRAEKPVYILMNKPKGYLTTTADPNERNTVMQILGNNIKERIYPVGRLDRNTTGLLLFTNDGDLADKLMHPSYNVKKIYRVDLDRPLTRADALKITEGVHLEEGKAMVDDLAIVSEDGKTVGLEIHIGWNRVVRRIFESLEYTVVKLDRSVYGGLSKKDLARGQWRFLTKEEIVLLKHYK